MYLTEIHSILIHVLNLTCYVLVSQGYNTEQLMCVILKAI